MFVLGLRSQGLRSHFNCLVSLVSSPMYKKGPGSRVSSSSLGSWVLCSRSHPWIRSQSLVSGLGPNFRVLCLRSRVPPLGSWVSGLGLTQKMGLRSRVRPKILGVGSHYLDMTYSLILFEFFDTVKSCSKELSIQWRPYKLSHYKYKYLCFIWVKTMSLVLELDTSFSHQYSIYLVLERTE